VYIAVLRVLLIEILDTIEIRSEGCGEATAAARWCRTRGKGAPSFTDEAFPHSSFAVAVFVHGIGWLFRLFVGFVFERPSEQSVFGAHMEQRRSKLRPSSFAS
jgi:hypothetical protein